MTNSATTSNLEQMSDNVKPTLNSQLPLPLDSMIHHKVSSINHRVLVNLYSDSRGKPYGVSPRYRLLSPGLLLKKWDYVVRCLNLVLGMSDKQQRVTLQLLRLWAYYGAVYPKESQVTWETWTSKATFWRTIRSLEDQNLITRVNRYVLRPHAQISNLYQLHNLVKLIALYLAEHIAHVWPDWFNKLLPMTWPELWVYLKSPLQVVSKIPLEIAVPTVS